MRILHLADLHLHAPWLEWVSSHAGKFDAVVVAGDTMNAFSRTGLRQQMRTCREWLLSLPTPTIVCSGNHDHWVKDRRVSVDVAAEGGWIRSLRGQGNIIGVDGDIVDVDGVKLAVSGWLQPRWPEADVVVYHAPPAGCVCALSGQLDVGDQDAADHLRESAPRLYLSGHIHHGIPWCVWPPSKRKTLVLVPGCAGAEAPPAHWVIDFATGKAYHQPSGAVVAIPLPA